MATTLKSLPRHKVLKESLLAEISELKPGARLASVKAMMARFDVSQATIDRALRGLKEDGLVESRVGRGLFVAEKSPESKSLGLVDLLAFGGERMLRNPGFNQDFVNELAHHLGFKGRGLRVTTIPRGSDQAIFNQRIEELSPDAVIAMYPDMPNICSSLAVREIPYVQVIPYWPSDLPNSFLLDNRAIVQCWIKHLTGLGHTRIAFLHGVLENAYNRDMNERLQFFYEEMAKAGILLDSEMLLHGGFENKDGYAATKELLRRNREFTAVIVDDHAAKGVYQALEEAGRRVGKDVSVIGIDDLAHVKHLSPPLTTIRISRSSFAQQVIQSLEAIADGSSEGFTRSMVPVRLIERESVVHSGVQSRPSQSPPSQSSSSPQASPSS